jgi:outer membrane protein insertion porin family
MASILLGCCGAIALAQTYTPTSILFKGAAGYTDADLLAATGLKTGVPMTSETMNDAVRILVDTGLFDDVSFQFKGGELVFTITPSTTLKDVALDNLPLRPDAELEGKIRARIPLYRGKVPTDGKLLEAVRQVLEEEVDGQGINATIIVLRSSIDDPAIHFQQSIPRVRVGTITVNGASPGLAPEARHVLERFESIEYSTKGSPSQLETELGNYYRQHGYLKATVQATLQRPPVVSPDGVDLPFQVTVKEGPQFRLGKVQLGPELGITQESFEQETDMRPGAVAQEELLHSAWQKLAGDFHNRGYLRARIAPIATWDTEKALVGFNVTAEPGARYSMGKLTIDNANDELREAINAEWALPAGAVFNPQKLLGGIESKAKDPDLLRYLAREEIKYTMHLNDDNHTVDVTLHLEKKNP